jgi:dUTP pyrophosphatase
MPTTVKIVNKSQHPIPAYATAGSSGVDIRANIEQSITLSPLERVLIPTGLFFEMPEHLEAQVRPRSGLAIKQGLTCLNTPGTIDADYRGEVKVIIINLSNDVQTIHNGDRIAQVVFQVVEQVAFQQVDQLNETDRGAGGFGHTGKN